MSLAVMHLFLVLIKSKGENFRLKQTTTLTTAECSCWMQKQNTNGSSKIYCLQCRNMQKILDPDTKYYELFVASSFNDTTVYEFSYKSVRNLQIGNLTLSSGLLFFRLGYIYFLYNQMFANFEHFEYYPRESQTYRSVV